MINLEAMPCSNCIFCNGVKQPNGTEIGEYVSCTDALDGNSLNNLKLSDSQLKCIQRKKKIE